MAGGTTTVIMVVKKFITDLFSDPEKIIKYFLLFIILPLLLIMLLFSIPYIALTNIPSIFLSDSKSGLSDEQLNIIKLYQDAPDIINQNNLQWISSMKNKYSWCNDVEVQCSFNLTWQQLMAIDTVLKQQNFKNIKLSDIVLTGDKFLIRNVHIEKYTVVKTVQIIVKGVKVTQSYPITKTRAVIVISSKPFENVLLECGLSAHDIDVAKTVYNTLLNTDLEGNLNIYDDTNITDLKEYPAGTASIPYYNQADARWGYVMYGKTGTIKTSGCGPTSLSMVVAGLTKNYSITPLTMANWSVAHGYRVEGEGSAWALMTNGGRTFGLKVTQVSRTNPNAILNALSHGYPVIAVMGRGHFTKGGHYIVLKGITKDGKIIVYDCASVKRTNQTWDLSIIMSESSTNGGINGSPFWIFEP